MKNKSKITLAGGFGNQLHQISFALYLMKLNHEIKFDLSARPNLNLLSKFDDELFKFVNSKTIKFSRILPSLIGDASRLGKIISALIHPFTEIVLDLSALGPNLTLKKGSTHYVGYFQRESYASHLKDFIATGKKEHAHQIQKRIAIHIRLGDYYASGVNLPFQFYDNVIANFQSDNQFAKYAICIVSNDIDMCVKKLSHFQNIVFFQGDSDYEDFLFMLNSEVLVCSRSTFSWWAGYLSKGLVFYPSPWDLSNPQGDHFHIPSHGWRKICNVKIE
jgi:hypothetical protein